MSIPMLISLPSFNIIPSVGIFFHSFKSGVFIVNSAGFLVDLYSLKLILYYLVSLFFSYYRKPTLGTNVAEVEDSN